MNVRVLGKNYFSIIIIALSIQLFSSCNFSKNTDVQLAVPDVDSEDKEIVSFLVQTTDINSTIIQLSKIAVASSKSVEVKDVFANQVKLSTELQKRILIISTERFVTTPLTNKRPKIKYSDDVQLLDLLMNELVLQVTLFEKISKSTSDSKILNLKNEFLPKLNIQSQIVSSLKVKKIVTK